MDYLCRYLMIGGMPEAVRTYAQTGSYFEVRKVLGELYDNYLGDMELYQASRESILRSRTVFENIYGLLNRESKSFSPGYLKKNARTRDFASPLEWLLLARVIHQSWQLPEHVTLPLAIHRSPPFRVFLCDMGMFSWQSGINATAFMSPERQTVLSGVFFENYVACELASRGVPVRYWKGRGSGEFEFVAESNGRLYPIDVKRGRGALNSLEKFSHHNSFEYAVKVSRNNFGYDSGKKLLTVPLYWMPFVARDLAQGTMRGAEEYQGS